MKIVAALSGTLALAALVLTGVTVPRAVIASTGCCVTLSDVVQRSSAMVVATSEGAVSERAYRLAVDEVLKGAPARVLTYRAASGEPAMPAGTRWIIVIYPADPAALRTGVLSGRWDEAWPVAPDGRISPPALVIAPANLTAFLAWFGLPATDTTGANELSAPGSTVFLAAACAAAALGLLVINVRLTARPRAR